MVLDKPCERKIALNIEKYNPIIDTMKDVKYGFISKCDNKPILDREWIHGCKNLQDYYETNWDPRKTIADKLGICLDQSLAIVFLFKRKFPEIPTQIYALRKGRFGHAVPTFVDDGKHFYLENAWDKELGLHGPFDSKEELEEYLDGIYHKHHDKDNDDPVTVERFSIPMFSRRIIDGIERDETPAMRKCMRDSFEEM